MSCVIDIQGFKGLKHTFILKEIAIITHDGMFQHFIIKPPYEFNCLPPKLQNQAKWLYNYHHGHQWNDGYTSLNNIKQLFINIFKDKSIFINGKDKIKWILDTFDLDKNNVMIYNIKEIDCPSLAQLRKIYLNLPRCISHSGVCALENVFLYKEFLDDYYLSKKK